MNALKKIISFLLPKLRSVMRFMVAQGITLVGNLVYGLLCVRLLPTADYAQFVVLFGVQATLVILMDVNFSGSLIPLVGERVDDRQLIADYVASLRVLAVRVYLIVGAGLIIFYPLLVRHRNWSWQVVAAMVVTLLVSTWFMRMGSAYGAVLIMLRDRDTWYLGQMISSLGTLLLLGVFYFFHALHGFTAILLNVAGIIFVGVFYFYRSRKLLATVGVATEAKRKAIIKLALPNVPQSIFYALQGQISLMLITYFGRTAGVAGVGALGRLGQIFALFLQMNPILVEPYFAKISKSKLMSSYFAALAIAGIVCLAITAFAWQFPEIFLWVLGPQYGSLRFEVLISIGTGAVSCFSGVLWCVHSARKFIYWWSNILSVSLIFVVQAAFVAKADLSTIRTVLLMNLGTNLASLFVNILCGFYGFTKGGREVEPIAPIIAGGDVEPIEYIEPQETKILGPTP